MPKRRIEASLSPLISRWASQDKELLAPMFKEVRSGKKPGNGNPDAVPDSASLMDRKALDDSLATLDSSGRVAELFGIAREPTSHRVNFSGDAIFSCCALVAHTAPAIFEYAATIESTDPISGEKVIVEISRGLQISGNLPAETCASLVDCQLAEFLKNPRDAFCRHVKHFRSAETAEEFCSQDNRRYIVDIAEFHAAAQYLFHQVWGSSLGR